MRHRYQNSSWRVAVGPIVCLLTSGVSKRNSSILREQPM